MNSPGRIEGIVVKANRGARRRYWTKTRRPMDDSKVVSCIVVSKRSPAVLRLTNTRPTATGGLCRCQERKGGYF